MIQPFFQRIFIKWLTKGLFKAITEEDVLSIVESNAGYSVHYRGKRLDPEAIIVLQEQAEQVLESRLWKMLNAEIHAKSQEHLYNSKTIHDMIFSHAMIYDLKILEAKLKKLASIK